MQYCLCFVFAFGITLPLWARAADSLPPQSVDYSMADARFRAMDTDNKGHISFEDFRKRYPNMQRPAFDAIDGNKDGTISLEEWRIFFQSHGAGGQMPPPGHSGRQGGRPLILPPAK